MVLVMWWRWWWWWWRWWWWKGNILTWNVTELRSVVRYAQAAICPTCLCYPLCSEHVDLVKQYTSEFERGMGPNTESSVLRELDFLSTVWVWHVLRPRHSGALYFATITPARAICVPVLQITLMYPLIQNVYSSSSPSIFLYRYFVSIPFATRCYANRSNSVCNVFGGYLMLLLTIRQHGTARHSKLCQTSWERKTILRFCPRILGNFLRKITKNKFHIVVLPRLQPGIFPNSKIILKIFTPSFSITLLTYIITLLFVFWRTNGSGK